VVHQLEFVLDIGDFDIRQGDPSRLEALVLESDHADVVAFSALVVWQINPLILQAVKDGSDGIVLRIREKS
jgi:hypothetical protein